jgi:group I intron endonuclease
MKSGVYQISFEQSDKKYIGSTMNLNRRRIRHLASLRHGAHGSTSLQKAFNEYGEKSFDFKVLLLCDPINCSLFEQRIVDAMRPEQLYNIRRQVNSNFGIKFSDEVKEKVRRASTGRKMSGEARRKISKARIGMRYSEETLRRMSEAKRKMTEDTKEKIRQARKKQIFTEETRHKLSLTSKKAWSEGCHQPMTEETREKFRTAHLGKKATPEACANMSASAKKAWAKRKGENK